MVTIVVFFPALHCIAVAPESERGRLSVGHDGRGLVPGGERYVGGERGGQPGDRGAGARGEAGGETTVERPDAVSKGIYVKKEMNSQKVNVVMTGGCWRQLRRRQYKVTELSADASCTVWCPVDRTALITFGST